MTYAADTWFSRDLPVLVAVAQLCDDPDAATGPAEVSGITGLDEQAVARAFASLHDANMIEGITIDQTAVPLYITKILPAGRREAGAWPGSPDALAQQLVTALKAAADAEADPARSRRLRDVAAWLGGTARDLCVEVAANLITRQTGLG